MAWTWTKTNVALICTTCRRTCMLEQAEQLRLRIEHHADIRDAIAIPQPPCPGGGQEQVLVATAKLDQARKNYVLTSDPRMESYYEGWREAACNLDPRVRQ